MDDPHVRRSDPHTSHKAVPGKKRLGAMKTLALRSARCRYNRGITWAEAEDVIKEKTGVELVRQSISPRFVELMRDGYIERRFDEKGEERTRMGKCGVPQIINWITPAGMAKLKAMGL